MPQYWKLFLFPFFLCFSGQVNSSEYFVSLKESKFELVTYGLRSQSLDFKELSQPKVFYLTYWVETPTVEVKYAGKSIFVNSTETPARVTLKYGEAVKTILFNIQHNPATYTDNYILSNQRAVNVETPEVYELANIILLLADSFHDANYKMHAEGSYVADVLTWFSPFKDHALFKSLDTIDYYSLVENAAAYRFDCFDIVKSSVYSGFRAKNAIKDLDLLMSDFAKESDFRAFYEQKGRYYRHLEERFLDSTKPKNIWAWLEDHFPAKYQSYKVFFSPLGPGNHSARNFTKDDYKEAIVFISAPSRYENQTDNVTEQAIKLTRSFFTEIDHTYVNPVSDKYLTEINEAFVDLKPWYKGGGYNTPYLTFNEYMTWSLFSLYAMDNYTDEDFQFAKKYIEDFMVDRRGFHRFKEFNDEMILLYKKRKSGERIVNMYPMIIQWFKSR